MQTIYASKLATRPPVDSISERIELPDGDFLDINLSKRHSGPPVCLFHGLTGSIRSGYATGVFNALEHVGMRPVFMHWRGCSGEPNRLPRSYHSGATDDIGLMVDLAQKRFPGEPVFAVGYSLGANALLKYIGEQGEQCLLAGSVAVCPPLVLSVGADKLDSGLTRGYQRHLLQLMRSQHEAKRRHYPELGLPPAGPELDNFWKFDDALTAPLHGYRNVHDYYQQCSARQFLGNIRTPTHIIYALDDPFFTPAVVPEGNELSAQVTLELSASGGHVGFISASKENPFWLDSRVSNLLGRMAGAGPAGTV